MRQCLAISLVLVASFALAAKDPQGGDTAHPCASNTGRIHFELMPTTPPEWTACSAWGNRMPKLLGAWSIGMDGSLAPNFQSFQNVATNSGPNPMVPFLTPTGSTWLPNHAYGQWWMVHPSTPNGHIYRVFAPQDAGTTGATEPTWCTTTRCTVTDGTLKWTEFPPRVAKYGSTGLWAEETLNESAYYGFNHIGPYSNSALDPWKTEPSTDLPLIDPLKFEVDQGYGSLYGSTYNIPGRPMPWSYMIRPTLYASYPKPSSSSSLPNPFCSDADCNSAYTNSGDMAIRQAKDIGKSQRSSQIYIGASTTNTDGVPAFPDTYEKYYWGWSYGNMLVGDAGPYGCAAPCAADARKKYVVSIRLDDADNLQGLGAADGDKYAHMRDCKTRTGTSLCLPELGKNGAAPDPVITGIYDFEANNDGHLQDVDGHGASVYHQAIIGRQVLISAPWMTSAAQGAGSRGAQTPRYLALHPLNESKKAMTDFFQTLTRYQTTVNISAIARSGNVVTVTTATACCDQSSAQANHFAANTNVTIAGVTPSSFNGDFQNITIVDSTHFTFQQTGSNESGTVMGTVRGGDLGKLNAAWGSFYDNWNSDGVAYTATPAWTPNGTTCSVPTGMHFQTCTTGTASFSTTLAHAPSPFTITITENGEARMGDYSTDGVATSGLFAIGAATAGNGSVNYSTGAITATYPATAVPPSGATLGVSYISGGWGTGKGLWDEDGACPARPDNTYSCWVPADSRRLQFTQAGLSGNCGRGSAAAGSACANKLTTAQETNVQEAIADFTMEWSAHYFGTARTVVKAVDPALNYAGAGYLSNRGSHGLPQVLSACNYYCDLIPVTTYLPRAISDIPADKTNLSGLPGAGSCSTPGISSCGRDEADDEQMRWDYLATYAGDKPWSVWFGTPSYLSSPFFALEGTSQEPGGRYYIDGQPVDTQVKRGQMYNWLLNTQHGNRVVKGVKGRSADMLFWLGGVDDPSERQNWGIRSSRGNPYDGVSGVESVIDCPYSGAKGNYRCGGEWGVTSMREVWKTCDGSGAAPNMSATPPYPGCGGAAGQNMYNLTCGYSTGATQFVVNVDKVRYHPLCAYTPFPSNGSPADTPIWVAAGAGANESLVRPSDSTGDGTHWLYKVSDCGGHVPCRASKTEPAWCSSSDTCTTVDAYYQDCGDGSPCGGITYKRVSHDDRMFSPNAPLGNFVTGMQAANAQFLSFGDVPAGSRSSVSGPLRITGPGRME